MPEPTSTVAAATASIATSAVAVPVLAIFGVSLGIRADMLLAGFAGGIAAIAFLNAVPSTGDTWRELLRTTGKRVGFCIASAVFAAYTAPLLALLNGAGTRDEVVLGVAFVAGSGASLFLPWLIARLKGEKPGKPEGEPPPAAGGGVA
jgi:hypothetical protein